jgi:hypothetical protein
MIGEAVNSESDRPETVKPQTKPKRRFRIGCMGCLACGFFFFVLSCIGVKFGFVCALNSRVEALRVAGEPTTWAEVVARYEPVLDEENAVLVLEPLLSKESKGLERSPSVFAMWAHRTPFGARPSSEALELIRWNVDEHSAALVILHEAAKRPHAYWALEPHPSRRQISSAVANRCVSPVLWNSGGNGAHYPLDGVVGILEAEAKCHAAVGDGEKAAQAIFALRRMAACVDDYPFLATQSWRMYAAASACEAVEDVLSRCDISAQDLAMLRGEFEAEADQLSLHSAVRAARAGILWVVTDGRSLLHDEWMDGAERYDKLFSAVPGTVEMDGLRGLKCTTDWLASLDLPPREQMIAVDALQSTLWADADSWSCLLKGVIAINILWELNAGTRTGSLIFTKQRLHLARTALAVEQFRIERGRWPGKLTDLVPDYLDAVPQDWFASKGTRISYAHTPAGVRVWSGSVGKDLAFTGDEWGHWRFLARSICSFLETEGHLPKSLSAVVSADLPAIPSDPRTGKPYTYVTNAANPGLFILGGITDGMSEAEFWKQRISARDWISGFWDKPIGSRRAGICVFRLLNPELRGATQARFCEEIDDIDSVAEYLYERGYTPARLKGLGFSEDDVRSYESNLEWIKEEEAEERKRRGLPPLPEVPADTEMEPMP